MVPAALGMGWPSPGRCTGTFAGVYSYLRAADRQLILFYRCSGGSFYHHFLSGNRWACLLCVCIPKEISQEQLVNTSKTDLSPRAFPWASNKSENKELVLGETQQLFIQVTANGKKVTLRDRAGGKLWQWPITPEAIRAGDYLTAQHAHGTGRHCHLQKSQRTLFSLLWRKTARSVLPASNQMSFRQHLARVPPSVSLSQYFLGQIESCNHFSVQSTTGRSDPVNRGQSLCLQPQTGLHQLNLSCRSQFSSFTPHAGSQFGWKKSGKRSWTFTLHCAFFPKLLNHVFSFAINDRY